MKKRALVIAFEAADMMGKSCQARMLVENLIKHGYDAVGYEPVKHCTWMFKLLRYMLDTGAAKKHKNVFQLLQFTNRLLFQFTRFWQMRREHEIVVLDRWALSGLIYGIEDGASKLLTELLYSLLVKPDVIVVLHGEPFLNSRPVKDSYELDMDLQKRVNDAYFMFAATNDNTIAISTKNWSKLGVHCNVVAKLAQLGYVDFDKHPLKCSVEDKEQV